MRTTCLTPLSQRMHWCKDTTQGQNTRPQDQGFRFHCKYSHIRYCRHTFLFSHRSLINTEHYTLTFPSYMVQEACEGFQEIPISTYYASSSQRAAGWGPGIHTVGRTTSLGHTESRSLWPGALKTKRSFACLFHKVLRPSGMEAVRSQPCHHPPPGGATLWILWGSPGCAPSWRISPCYSCIAELRTPVCISSRQGDRIARHADAETILEHPSLFLSSENYGHNFTPEFIP